MSNGAIAEDVNHAAGSLKNDLEGNKQQKIASNCDEKDWSEKKWYHRYEQLIAFQRQNGHCDVPGTLKSLWRWVKTHRAFQERNVLRKDRKDLLDQLGFTWNGRSANEDKKWYRHYEKLVVFQRNHGHCNVRGGSKREVDKSLVTWVKNLRSNNNILPKDRRDLLDKIGFIWNVRCWNDDESISLDQKWNQQYGKLVDFHRKHGHSVVPCPYKEDKSLGRWVSRQRCSLIRPDRKVLMDQLGFVCRGAEEPKKQSLLLPSSPQEALPPAVTFPLSWDFMFEQLEKFKQTHGHVNILVINNNNAHDSWLAVWVKVQQQEVRDGLVERRRVKRLVDIGLSIDKVHKTKEHVDICVSKHTNADDPMVQMQEDKDPVDTLEEYRQVAAEQLVAFQQQRGHDQLNGEMPTKDGISSSDALSLPPATTTPFPLCLSDGIEFAVMCVPGSFLGLEFQSILVGNGCRVASIHHGSEAWQSGKIQVGDIVSKINGQSLSDFCYDAIMHLLRWELRQEVTFFRYHINS
jgi:hypothetical protein